MRFLFLSLLLILGGCGYRFGQETISAHYKTISIPFVVGDDQGILTTALIREISSQGSLHYCTCGGQLNLSVCLLPPDTENIGFRYANDEDGTLTKIVAAEEGRITITAKVSLIDKTTGCTVFGPVEITVNQTFDFETDFTTINFHKFSLGQLEMQNLAEDIAFRPLYEKLAQRIVDSVYHSW